MKPFPKSWAPVAALVVFILVGCASVPPLKPEQSRFPERFPARTTAGVGLPRVVAYYTSWSIYARNFKVSDAALENVTHLHYAFARLNAEDRLDLLDPHADLTKELGYEPENLAFHGNFAQLAAIRHQFPNLKVLISLLGSGEQAARISEMAADSGKRQVFVASVVEFLDKYGFDGFDLDWEYPELPDRDNLTALLSELRVALSTPGRLRLLSLAAGASPRRLANLDLAAVGQSLDYLNLMAYDFHGPWDNLSSHQAALFPDPVDPAQGGGWVASRYNAMDAVTNCLQSGFPAQKLVLGVPLYGRAWLVDAINDDGRFRPSTGAKPRGTWGSGNYDFDHISQLAAERPESVFHDILSAASWIYQADTGLFISYDSQRAIRAKAALVWRQGLGGLMFWELSADRRGKLPALAVEFWAGLAASGRKTDE